ncbi:MAG: aspartate dehydrogenase [Steroidobacteraceae bacterium]
MGLIGCGAIGRSVLAGLARDFGASVRVTGVLVRQAPTGSVLALPAGCAATTTLDGLLQTNPALVIECASHEAVHQFAAPVLAGGRDFLMVSIGALADSNLYDSLQQAAIRGGARLRLASGAVGGLDALEAMRRGGLDAVRYTGTKPPAAWRGSAAERLLDLGSLAEATTFFRGTSREAAANYPKNANVAATVALAGLGFDRTEVALVADPACTANQHVIEARGACGTIRFEIQAAPSANVRSSAIVADSVCRAIGALVDPVVQH